MCSNQGVKTMKKKAVNEEEKAMLWL